MSLQTWQKNALRIIAFLLVLLMLVLAVGHYLMPESNRYLEGYTAGGILGEDFDTIDVLVLGDSNAAQGIAPMKWYDEHGITGYTYAAGWLSMYNIYYRLKQIYEEQSPKVVVLCTAPAYTKKSSETYMQSALGDISDELLPLLRFHDNWKYLRPDNLFTEKDYSWRDVNKGYTPITDVAARPNLDYMYDTGASESIPWMVKFYMERILQLCADHDSQVLLVTVPAALGWNLARHNGIAAFAEENGVPYLDFNMADSNPGIDWTTDSADGGTHLNWLGAEKVTAALGDYLLDHYDLTDHRGQPGYETWDADSQSYRDLLPEITQRAKENADLV